MEWVIFMPCIRIVVVFSGLGWQQRTLYFIPPINRWSDWQVAAGS